MTDRKELSANHFLSLSRGPKKGLHKSDVLGPAKTHILRGTPQTYAIKTRAVTDN